MSKWIKREESERLSLKVDYTPYEFNVPNYIENGEMYVCDNPDRVVCQFVLTNVQEHKVDDYTGILYYIIDGFIKEKIRR